MAGPCENNVNANDTSNAIDNAANPHPAGASTLHPAERRHGSSRTTACRRRCSTTISIPQFINKYNASGTLTVLKADDGTAYEGKGGTCSCRSSTPDRPARPGAVNGSQQVVGFTRFVVTQVRNNNGECAVANHWHRQSVGLEVLYEQERDGDEPQSRRHRLSRCVRLLRLHLHPGASRQPAHSPDSTRDPPAPGEDAMSAVGRGLVRISGRRSVLPARSRRRAAVAAGLAAGPLVSAVQLVGDRTVERTVAAELAEAQGATEAVLARMAFRIESRERDDGIGACARWPTT